MASNVETEMSFPQQPITRTKKDTVALFIASCFLGCLAIGCDFYLFIETNGREPHIIGLLTGTLFAFSGMIGLVGYYREKDWLHPRGVPDTITMTVRSPAGVMETVTLTTRPLEGTTENFLMTMNIITAILCWPLILARGIPLLQHWIWNTYSTEGNIWQIVYCIQVLTAWTQKGVSIATAISANRKKTQAQDSAGQVYRGPYSQNNVPVWNP